MDKNSRGPVYASVEYGQFERPSHIVSFPLNFTPGYEGVSSLVTGETFNVTTKGGSDVDIDTAMQAIILNLRKLLAVGGNVRSYAVYGMSSPEAEPRYLFGGEAANTLITPAGIHYDDIQMTITYRTKKGGQYRFVWSDCPYPQDTVGTPSSMANDATLQSLYLYMFSSNCVVVGRDGAFMASGIRMLTKQNDRARRKRLGL